MTSWVLVDSFPNENEALLARGMLDANGVPSQLRLNARGDALLGALGVATGPMDLFAQEQHVATAKRLLGNEK